MDYTVTLTVEFDAPNAAAARNQTKRITEMVFIDDDVNAVYADVPKNGSFDDHYVS